MCAEGLVARCWQSLKANFNPIATFSNCASLNNKNINCSQVNPVTLVSLSFVPFVVVHVLSDTSPYQIHSNFFVCVCVSVATGLLLRCFTGASGQNRIVRTHSEVIEQFDSFSLLKLLFLVRNWHCSRICWSRTQVT